MKYISIGNNCSVKYNIDKYKGNCETLFFDWLMTSMNSVIHILDSDNINNILYLDNIVNITTPIDKNNSRISIKSLNFCCSIHDVPINYTDNDILDFIHKYTRRFNRFIEYIKSTEKICFIRNGNVSNVEIDKFIETIKKINPNCDFTLVVINNNKNNENLLKQNHLLIINLNIDIPTNYDWTQQFLNWENIFSVIDKNS